MLDHFCRSELCFLEEKKLKDDLRANMRDNLWFRNVAHLGFILWGLVKKKKEEKQKLCLRSNRWVWFLHNGEKVNDGAHYTSLIIQPSLSL